MRRTSKLVDATEMERGEHISRSLRIAVVAVVMALPYPCLAQQPRHQAAPPPAHRTPSPPAQHTPAAPAQRPPAPQQNATRPQQPMGQQSPTARQQGHAGDWLRRYKDLPPAEQERALQNDPAFHNLPQARQELLKPRRQRFSKRPPQEQLRVLNRMETWEHLTPEQKQQAREVF